MRSLDFKRRMLRRDDHDWGAEVPSQVQHDGFSIHVGQAEVDDKRIPGSAIKVVDGFLTGAGHRDAEAADLHRRNDGANHLRVVIYK